MILFIKDRIKKRIRMFKERKAENETGHKNKTTTGSTGLENGHSNGMFDYGQIFGGTQTLTKDLNNDDVDSMQNSSARFEIDTQQS